MTVSAVPIALLDDLARTVDAFLHDHSHDCTDAYRAMREASERVQRARWFPVDVDL